MKEFEETFTTNKEAILQTETVETITEKIIPWMRRTRRPKTTTSSEKTITETQSTIGDNEVQERVSQIANGEEDSDEILQQFSTIENEESAFPTILPNEDEDSEYSLSEIPENPTTIDSDLIKVEENTENQSEQEQITEFEEISTTNKEAILETETVETITEMELTSTYLQDNEVDEQTTEITEIEQEKAGEISETPEITENELNVVQSTITITDEGEYGVYSSSEIPENPAIIDFGFSKREEVSQTEQQSEETIEFEQTNTITEEELTEVASISLPKSSTINAEKNTETQLLTEITVGNEITLEPVQTETPSNSDQFTENEQQIQTTKAENVLNEGQNNTEEKTLNPDLEMFTSTAETESVHTEEIELEETSLSSPSVTIEETTSENYIEHEEISETRKSTIQAAATEEISKITTFEETSLTSKNKVSAIEDEDILMSFVSETTTVCEECDETEHIKDTNKSPTEEINNLIPDVQVHETSTICEICDETISMSEEQIKSESTTEKNMVARTTQEKVFKPSTFITPEVTTEIQQTTQKIIDENEEFISNTAKNEETTISFGNVEVTTTSLIQSTERTNIAGEESEVEKTSQQTIEENETFFTTTETKEVLEVTSTSEETKEEVIISTNESVTEIEQTTLMSLSSSFENTEINEENEEKIKPSTHITTEENEEIEIENTTQQKIEENTKLITSSEPKQMLQETLEIEKQKELVTVGLEETSTHLEPTEIHEHIIPSTSFAETTTLEKTTQQINEETENGTVITEITSVMEENPTVQETEKEVINTVEPITETEETTLLSFSSNFEKSDTEINEETEEGIEPSTHINTEIENAEGIITTETEVNEKNEETTGFEGAKVTTSIFPESTEKQNTENEENEKETPTQQSPEESDKFLTSTISEEMVEVTSTFEEISEIEEQSVGLEETTTNLESTDIQELIIPSTSFQEISVSEKTTQETNEENEKGTIITEITSVIEENPTVQEETEKEVINTVEIVTEIEETTLLSFSSNFEKSDTEINEETEEAIEPSTHISTEIENAESIITTETEVNEKNEIEGTTQQTPEENDKFLTSTKTEEMVEVTSTFEDTSEIEELSVGLEETSTHLEPTDIHELIIPSSSLAQTSLLEKTTQQINEETENGTVITEKEVINTVEPITEIEETTLLSFSSTFEKSNTEINEENEEGIKSSTHLITEIENTESIITTLTRTESTEIQNAENEERFTQQMITETQKMLEVTSTIEETSETEEQKELVTVALEETTIHLEPTEISEFVIIPTTNSEETTETQKTTQELIEENEKATVVTQISSAKEEHPTESSTSLKFIAKETTKTVSENTEHEQEVENSESSTGNIETISFYESEITSSTTNIQNVVNEEIKKERTTQQTIEENGKLPSSTATEVEETKGMFEVTFEETSVIAEQKELVTVAHGIKTSTLEEPETATEIEQTIQVIEQNEKATGATEITSAVEENPTEFQTSTFSEEQESKIINKNTEQEEGVEYTESFTENTQTAIFYENENIASVIMPTTVEESVNTENTKSITEYKVTELSEESKESEVNAQTTETFSQKSETIVTETKEMNTFFLEQTEKYTEVHEEITETEKPILNIEDNEEVVIKTSTRFNYEFENEENIISTETKAENTREMLETVEQTSEIVNSAEIQTPSVEENEQQITEIVENQTTQEATVENIKIITEKEETIGLEESGENAISTTEGTVQEETMLQISPEEKEETQAIGTLLQSTEVLKSTVSNTEIIEDRISDLEQDEEAALVPFSSNLETSTLCEICNETTDITEFNPQNTEEEQKIMEASVEAHETKSLEIQQTESTEMLKYTKLAISSTEEYAERTEAKEHNVEQELNDKEEFLGKSTTEFPYSTVKLAPATEQTATPLDEVKEEEEEEEEETSETVTRRFHTSTPKYTYFGTTLMLLMSTIFGMSSATLPRTTTAIYEDNYTTNYPIYLTLPVIFPKSTKIPSNVPTESPFIKKLTTTKYRTGDKECIILFVNEPDQRLAKKLNGSKWTNHEQINENFVSETPSPTVINDKFTPNQLHLPSNVQFDGCDETEFDRNNQCACVIDTLLTTIINGMVKQPSIVPEIKCKNYLKINRGIIIDNKQSAEIRKRRSFLFGKHDNWRQREIVGHDIGYFQRDFRIRNTENYIYTLPNAQIIIPCNNHSEIGRFTENSWIFNDDERITAGITEDGSLEIDNVSPSQSGNYTCNVSSHLSPFEGNQKFYHSLIVVTTPIYKIRTNILYDLKNTCKLIDGDILYNYLPKIFNEFICGFARKICHVEIKRPHCLNEDETSTISMTFTVTMLHLPEIVPVDNNRCQINCQMDIVTQLAAIIVKNIQILDKLTIYSQLDIRQSIFIPKYNQTSYRSSHGPILMVLCPAGFGIKRKHPGVCVACPKNTYSVGNESYCKICPIGQYQHHSGSNSCTICSSPLENSACLRVLYTNAKHFEIYVAVAFLCVILLLIGLLLLTFKKSNNDPNRVVYYKAPRRREDAESGLTDPLLPRIKRHGRPPPSPPPPDF